ncbi:MAG: hypothetical protein K0S54_1152 [Alphaproteobacteria bacterium]|jgi:hypothetical protein|nr:hypothetical protein [Alphaproteobacteria bacterium]
MALWRVEFFIGATVAAPDRHGAPRLAKRELERRYGLSVVQAIEEQANAIVVFAVQREDAH